MASSFKDFEYSSHIGPNVHYLSNEWVITGLNDAHHLSGTEISRFFHFMSMEPFECYYMFVYVC